MNIVITGATGGLGAAMVRAYAGPGVVFLLTGRNGTRLAEIVAAARAQGAEAHPAQVDIRDQQAMASALGAFDAAHPVDLLIVNAGVTSGLGRDAIDPSSRRQVEVNLIGALNAAEPIIPRMLARGAGHIALVSSLAALRPQPVLAAYSASKAGLRAWGLAMAPVLRDGGVGMTIICPGFISTPMAARHKGAKPLEVSAGDAATRIRQGIAAGRLLVTFPWPMALLIRFGNLFPAHWSYWWERRFSATIVSDGED